MKQLYRKSEILFAILCIVIYIIGNSITQQLSTEIGFEMVLTIPFNALLIGTLFLFIRSQAKNEYYGIQHPITPAKACLFYIPLLIIATVNIWFGFIMRMRALETIIQIAAMILIGVSEELIFRGFLYKAICQSSVRKAIILTSILFGAGHIVNLFNGSGMDVLETVCQLFYAASIGLLFASVLFRSGSLVPCMIAHAVFNSLSVFCNESAFERVQIPVCIALCVISTVSAALIFLNGKKRV